MKVRKEDLKVVKVKTLYKNTIISHSKSEAWVMLINYINEHNEPTLFDFEGIMVHKPWLNSKFTEFISMDNVYIQLHYSEKECSTINILYIMNVGKSITKAFNHAPQIVEEAPKKKDDGVDKFAREQLMGYFDEPVDGVVNFRFTDRISQIGKNITVDYLIRAIEIHSENTGNTKYNVDLHKLVIVTSSISHLVDKQKGLLMKGIELKITHEDPKTAENFRLYTHIDNLNIEDDKKLDIIKRKLVMNKVGMLIKYKTGRGKKTDDFGRAGSEVISSRAAIYKGMEVIKDKVHLVFITFNSDTLYTKVQWAIENDGQELKELKTDIVKIPFEQVGIMNEFMGSHYHFSSAMQQVADKFFTVIKPDQTRVKCTIPERIKIVFDDWKVTYNKVLLKKDIDDTRKYLGLD